MDLNELNYLELFLVFPINYSIILYFILEAKIAFTPLTVEQIYQNKEIFQESRDESYFQRININFLFKKNSFLKAKFRCNALFAKYVGQLVYLVGSYEYSRTEMLVYIVPPTH